MFEKLFKKREIIIIAAVVILSAAVFLFMRTAGEKGNIAVVTYNGDVIEEIDLNNDGIYYIDGDFMVTLEVANNKIRFINPLCPDHVCEAFGWIGEEYEYAICMPARVSVQIKAS